MTETLRKKPARPVAAAFRRLRGMKRCQKQARDMHTSELRRPECAGPG